MKLNTVTRKTMFLSNEEVRQVLVAAGHPITPEMGLVYVKDGLGVWWHEPIEKVEMSHEEGTPQRQEL